MVTFHGEAMGGAGVEKRVGTVVADAGYASKKSLEKAEAAPCEFFIATKKDRVHERELKEVSVSCDDAPEGSSARLRMEQRLKTERGREAYKKRGQTVEPVFGRIKEGLAFNRFMMRGLEACQGEWSLACAAHNILKLLKSRAAVSEC